MYTQGTHYSPAQSEPLSHYLTPICMSGQAGVCVYCVTEGGGMYELWNLPVTLLRT
jgi:hypothetical protein